MPSSCKTQKVISGATISANVNSPILDKGGAAYLSFQPVWSGGGTPAGNFQIFGSNDLTNLPNVGSTSTITNGKQIGSNVAIAGNAGTAILPDPNAAAAAIQCYRFVQFTYAFTSGTASLDCHYHCQKES